MTASTLGFMIILYSSLFIIRAMKILIEKMKVETRLYDSCVMRTWEKIDVTKIDFYMKRQIKYIPDY